jgi:hypothetical protein
VGSRGYEKPKNVKKRFQRKAADRRHRETFQKIGPGESLTDAQRQCTTVSEMKREKTFVLLFFKKGRLSTI